jgi:hypothetical protein
MSGIIKYPPILRNFVFQNYLNQKFDGKLNSIEIDGFRLDLFIKIKMGFKVGYLVGCFSESDNQIKIDDYPLVFDKFQKYFSKNKMVDFIFPPIHLSNFSKYPVKSNYWGLGIIRLNLENKTIDQLFSNFKSVFRRHIRNAEKDEVKVVFGLEYFDQFYNLYSKRLINENAVFDTKAALQELLDKADENYSFQCGLAIRNGNIDAAILNLSDESNAYYMFGASSNNAHNGSFRLLHWELIKLYQSSNLKSYQLGALRGQEINSEKHQRLADFKLGFGADVVEGYHFDWILSPWKYKIYKLLIFIKSKF